MSHRPSSVNRCENASKFAAQSYICQLRWMYKCTFSINTNMHTIYIKSHRDANTTSFSFMSLMFLLRFNVVMRNQWELENVSLLFTLSFHQHHYQLKKQTHWNEFHCDDMFCKEQNVIWCKLFNTLKLAIALPICQ